MKRTLVYLACLAALSQRAHVHGVAIFGRPAIHFTPKGMHMSNPTPNAQHLVRLMAQQQQGQARTPVSLVNRMGMQGAQRGMGATPAAVLPANNR